MNSLHSMLKDNESEVSEARLLRSVAEDFAGKFCRQLLRCLLLMSLLDFAPFYSALTHVSFEKTGYIGCSGAYYHCGVHVDSVAGPQTLNTCAADEMV